MESIQSAKRHLETLRANKERRRELHEASQVLLMDDGTVNFASLSHKGVLQDLPDSFGETDDFTAAMASLDVQDYLQWDADTLVKTALLSLRSDTRC